MTRFYVLKEWSRDEDTGSQTDYLIVEPSNTGEAEMCDTCGKAVSMLAWLPPHRAELECWGRTFGDLAFGAGNNMLVSQRFKCLYEERGFTGLSGFDPVEIVGIKRYAKHKGVPPRYYCVTVGRTQTAIDQDASGFEWADAPVCAACRLARDLRRWARTVLEPGTWTGEDLFFARGLPSTILASERFKDFCESVKIANAVLVPAEVYGYDFYPDKGRPESLVDSGS